MAHIAVLDAHVANLIAAGEVVERPASAAKELMENAIDAGARAVTVEIEHGGLTFLRVTDDGRGIAPDELATAFCRHATSKLSDARDLEAIATLGFRGEALAAIAAVSRVQAMSRTAQSEFGASLHLEGGVPGPVEEAGCPLGTTVVVRDLFYNTPARLKFMKKDAAEGAAVFAAVQNMALSHPEVRVKFIRDGKQELLTPGDGTLEGAVYAVLGRELALGLLPVKSTGAEVSVSGFVSMPTCCRASRSYQHFFVNGRYVKSRLVMAALEEAYRNQKMVGKFPACVLHVELSHAWVDVNVHPAKTEVKFAAERAVFSAVYQSVLATLDGDGNRPAVSVSAPAPQPAPHDTVTPHQTRMSAPLPTGHGLSVSSYYALTRNRQAGHAEQTPASQPPRPPLHTPGDTVSETAPDAAGETVPPVQADADTPPVRTVADSPAALHDLPQSVPASSELDAVPPKPAEHQPAPAPEPEPEPEVQPWRVAGEILRTYIVVEQGERVLLIDKHAAHERLNFDRMKAENYEPMVQTLLAPVTVKLSGQEREVLLDNLPVLERFGFGVEDFGGALLVRRAPFDVDAGAIEGTLAELAQTLMQTGRADPAAARDALLRTMACKAAIKGGWTTGDQELAHLAQAVLSGQVKYCPHGRPVAVELTRYEIEKRFGRA